MSLSFLNKLDFPKIVNLVEIWQPKIRLDMEGYHEPINYSRPAFGRPRPKVTIIGAAVMLQTIHPKSLSNLSQVPFST